MAKNNCVKNYVILLWDGNEHKVRYLFAVHIRGGVPEIDAVDCCCHAEKMRLPKFSHAEAHCLCAFL